MDQIKRSQLIENIESDIQIMMSRAGQMLITHVRSLSDEQLQSFSTKFDETHRILLLKELASSFTNTD